MFTKKGAITQYFFECSIGIVNWHRKGVISLACWPLYTNHCYQALVTSLSWPPPTHWHRSTFKMVFICRVHCNVIVLAKFLQMALIQRLKINMPSLRLQQIEQCYNVHCTKSNTKNDFCIRYPIYGWVARVVSHTKFVQHYTHDLSSNNSSSVFDFPWFWLFALNTDHR